MAWFNAADFVDADGSAVTTWADGYRLHNVTQATSTAKPTAQTVNGVRVVRFDGGDRLASATFTPEPQPITVAVLVKLGVVTVNTLPSGADNTVEPVLNGGSGTINAGVGNVLLHSALYSTTDFHTILAVISGGSSKLRVDGVEVTGSTGTGGLSVINLGTNNAGAGGFKGDIAEMIVLGHASNADEITKIEAYLNAKKTDLTA